MLAVPQRLSMVSLRPGSSLLTLVVGALAYAVVAPALAVLHESIVLGMALLAGAIADLATTSDLPRALPLDPIYTSALLLTLSGIHVQGLALAGPLGEALHAHWPLAFESPSLVAPGSWASAIIAPGATVVSRWLCSAVADAAQIGLGLLAFRYGRLRRPWLAVAGAIVQAHVVAAHLIDVPPDLADVEAAGLPFAVTMLTSGDVQGGPRLSAALAALPPVVLDAVLGLGMVILAYLPVALLALAAWAVRLVAGRRSPRQVAVDGDQTAGSPGVPSRAPLLAPLGSRLYGVASAGQVVALATFGLAVALSPLGDLGDAQTRFLAAAYESPAADDQSLATPIPAPAPAASTTGAAPTTAALAPIDAGPAAPPLPVSDEPSVVAVTGSDYHFQYTVNGVPRVIRGIGYNVQYRHLPDDERARRLDADFARLRDAGVTTIFGWEPGEFDRVLLDAAQRHGLGVAPPFELDPDADYADPAVRARITQAALAWVQQYREHPAVRMWAIGNEVLHKLVYPSWMPVRSDPAWENRARAFASFYVELIDKVHALDPDHPIVHRDAEDAYLTWLRDEMAKGGRRPWFIYGVNAYTPRLAEILNDWPEHGWDVPLLVSEFAPGGMSPADRPAGFRSMWKMIRAANGWVIGGAVYAWTTDGPEEVDRVFGLVDADGNPVDGAFAAISDLYRGVARQYETDRTSPKQIYDERVWAFARQAVQTVQAGRSDALLPQTADTSVMGDVGAVSRAPLSDADLEIQRVRDPRRVAWGRDAGVTGEWWVSWRPPDQPQRKLSFVVQEQDSGTLGVRYIYFGPR